MDTLILENDRVRENTRPASLVKIDRITDANILYYSRLPKDLIRERILELNEEWDTERVLQMVSGTNILLGITLGILGRKRWYLLSLLSAAFLIQNARQGWCPTLALIRKYGVRTKNEIDRERNALMEMIRS